MLLRQESVSGDKSKLLTQNILLLQRKMENGVKTLKDKMKKDLQKERKKHWIEMQNAKVRFPTHTTNVNHSTFIQPSAFLVSSDSLPKFTSL